MIDVSKETFYQIDSNTPINGAPSLKEIASTHFGKSYDPLEALAQVGEMYNGLYQIFSVEGYEKYAEVDEDKEAFDEWIHQSGSDPIYSYIMYRLIKDEVIPDGKYLINFWW